MAAGFFTHARTRPEAVAMVTDAQRITYADLAGRARQVAGMLIARGIDPGQRIICAVRNRPAFFEILMGAALAHVEVIPIPWRAAAEELAYYVADSGARLTIGEHEGCDLQLGGSYERARDAAPPVEQPNDERPPRMRFYTSGTTGRPKAVERARPAAEDYLSGVEAAMGVLDLAATDEVHLVCGPLYHAAPLAYATYALLMGQRVVLPDRFDAATVLRVIESERVTWSMMVPIHFIRILALPDEVRARADTSSMRRLLHGAAPCPPEVKRRIMALFPGAVWEFYGMTEGRGTLIGPDEWLTKPGSVGRPYPGVEITVRAEDGNALPPGTVGLVYVRDGTRFSYAGAPDKTEQAWRWDAYTVGDMGYLDQDGYLFLTDRAVDLIITGGSNVYPAEVEAALHAHAAVADCAVIGIPDDEWGEQVLAVVEPRGAAPDPAMLIEHCRRRLADYKCPRRVAFVERLPRDEAGKVRKRDLREPYWRERTRRV